MAKSNDEAEQMFNDLDPVLVAKVLSGLNARGTGVLSCRNTSDVWSCTRGMDHAGPHIAHATNFICAIWEDDNGN